MKHVFKEATRAVVPRRDRRAEGQDGLSGAADELDGRVRRVTSSATCSPARAPAVAPLIDNASVLAELEGEQRFGRKIWGLLCLELWQRAFHDREHDFKRLLTDERTATTP